MFIVIFSLKNDFWFEGILKSSSSTQRLIVTFESSLAFIAVSELPTALIIYEPPEPIC